MCLLVSVIHKPYSEGQEEGEGVFWVEAGRNFVWIPAQTCYEEGMVHEFNESVHGS